MDAGVHLPQIDFTATPLDGAHLAEVVDAARDLGFAALCANDHLTFPSPWSDGLVLLAAAAPRAGSLELMTSGALPVLRGPRSYAAAMLTLERLAPGRVIAGVGPGSSRADYALAGIAWEERWSRFDAAAGVGWHEHGDDVIDGCERFFAPSYQAYLVDAWLPAAGLDEPLRRGVRVADIGCGHGASTVLMARAFPASTFVGSDYHEASIEVARERAREAGVDANTSFETSLAAEAGGAGFDVVTTFDALHDMGDPAGAARHVLDLLADGGSWLIVEPMAGDAPQDNFNPVGRAYYGFSTLLCTPASLSQDGRATIGTQAGPARVAGIVTGAGFASCETVATTPFHRVMLARRSG